jgi:hypothetical protein
MPLNKSSANSMQIDEMRLARSTSSSFTHYMRAAIDETDCKPQIMSLFATSLLLLGCSCFASATAPGWNAVREVTKNNIHLVSQIANRLHVQN